VSSDLSLKKISGIFKHEANGFNPVKRRKQVCPFRHVVLQNGAKTVFSQKQPNNKVLVHSEVFSKYLDAFSDCAH
jgi:hypothetical protein